MKSVRWLWLLTKRLYKKPLFVCLLALIPLAVLALRLVSKEDTGFVRIALAQENTADRLSGDLVEVLTEETGLLHFAYYATPHEATQAVVSGQADAAWIFEDRLKEKLEAFADGFDEDAYCVTVVERESTVLLQLVHEKLSALLYQHHAPQVYLNFIRAEVPLLDEESDDQLVAYYDEYYPNGDLFSYEYAGGDPLSNTADTGVLMTPVRGLLSVLMVLCGLATALFAIQDDERGTFTWVSLSRRPLVEFAGQTVAVFSMAVVVFVALAVTGLLTSWLREMALLLLYTVTCVLFAMVLRQLFGRLAWFAVWIPVLVVVLLAVCPVFYDLGLLRDVQRLFPPTYYLNAVNNNRYIGAMAGYTVVLLLLWMGLVGIKWGIARLPQREAK